MLLPVLPGLFAQERARSGKSAPAHAVIGGTVFRDSGFSLRGAEIVLVSDPEPQPGSKPRKLRLAAVSDGRGEFAFRVPAEPMRYTVRVSAPGFQSQRKTASVQGPERVELYFQLSPESR